MKNVRSYVGIRERGEVSSTKSGITREDAEEASWRLRKPS